MAPLWKKAKGWSPFEPWEELTRRSFLGGPALLATRAAVAGEPADDHSFEWQPLGGVVSVQWRQMEGMDDTVTWQIVIVWVLSSGVNKVHLDDSSPC